MAAGQVNLSAVVRKGSLIFFLVIGLSFASEGWLQRLL
jgi:hypothetical protein